MSSVLGNPGTVLLTGGTSGLGAALCERLLGQGYRVVVLARRAALMPAQAGLVPVGCDLADLAALPDVVARVIADHPDLSVIINNAGVQHARVLAESTPADLIEEAAVNLVAPALIVQAALPHLRARGAGAVVNISSGLARFPKEQGGLYSASKAGLSSFSNSLRWQVEGTGIVVSEVVLPLVDTPMTAGRGRGKITPEAAAEAVLRGVAAGRPVIAVGKARLLPVLGWLAPWALRRMMRRG